MNETMSWNLPELQALHSSKGLVRVPPELDVPFTRRVRGLVDTSGFQRLKGISQLGLVSQVYPGATHSRFEHSLGVFHNALQYLAQLSGNTTFRQQVDEHQASVFLVAALLHDLGHWPFCHPIEDLGISGIPSHESAARHHLNSQSELCEVLKTDWNIEPDEVLELLAPQKTADETKLLRSLISGPIDIDKLDYLDRDSMHAGVPYGRNFDRRRLIQSLTVNRAGDGLALSAKGKTAAELMVFARYVMFSEVYWHHAVRAATAMFARCFYELHSRLDLNVMMTMDEHQFVQQMQQAGQGSEAVRLIDSLFGRKRVLYKRAGEYSANRDEAIYQAFAHRPYSELVPLSVELAQVLSHQWGEPVSPLDVLIDGPPPHREVQFNIEIYDAKRDEYQQLSEVSPVVEVLAKKQFDDYVKRVRVFIHPRLHSLTKSKPLDPIFLEFAQQLNQQ